MARIVILYASSEGQTAKIAHFMAEHLEGRGTRVHVQNVDEIGPEFALDDYDAAIVGGSIHLGRVQAKLRSYVRRHREQLEAMPSAFFMVCMAVASKLPNAPEEVKGLLETFEKDTGWHPTRAEVFAGALRYSQYGWLTKMVMRAIAKHEGGETDTSHDYEYTSWDAVARFAEGVNASLTRAA